MVEELTRDGHPAVSLPRVHPSLYCVGSRQAKPAFADNFYNSATIGVFFAVFTGLSSPQHLLYELLHPLLPFQLFIILFSLFIPLFDLCTFLF